MKLITFSKRACLKLLVLMFYLTGCGGPSSFQNVPDTQSFDEVMLQLAREIHKVIYSASAKGTIPPSLDVGISRVVEQSSEREYLFGREIKRDLIGKLRQQLSTTEPTQNSMDINYLEIRRSVFGKTQEISRMGDLVQTHLYQAFTKPRDETSSSIIASKLKANLIIRGEYRLLQNRDILISLRIVLPQQNRIIDERQVRLKNKQILSRYYYTSFSEGIEKNFKDFYDQLKIMKFDDIFRVLNLRWREEYQWRQREKTRQLVVEKVDLSFKDFRRQLNPLPFVPSLELLNKEWRWNLYSYLHQAEVQKLFAEKLSPVFPNLQKTLLSSDFKHFVETAAVHKSYLLMAAHIESKSFWEINDILESQWRPQFTGDHRKQILKLARQKMKSALGELGNFVPNVRELRIRRVNIRSLRRSIFLRKIDRAIRLSDKEKINLMNHEKKLFLIEKALRDGFPVTAEFIASSPRNEPLGFSCEGLFSNKKVSLTLQETTLSHLNSTCKSEGLRQIITWPNPYHLFSFGKIRVQAVEKNLLFADKKFKGTVIVNKENLLHLYQKKRALFPIQGSDYSIRFTRLP